MIFVRGFHGESSECLESLCFLPRILTGVTGDMFAGSEVQDPMKGCFMGRSMIDLIIETISTFNASSAHVGKTTRYAATASATDLPK